MDDLKLKFGCTRYDHVRALFDGSVGIEGVDAKIVSEIFEKMIGEHAYDFSELGLTFYLRRLEMEDPPFVAIPIFPTGSSGTRRFSSTKRAALNGLRCQPRQRLLPEGRPGLQTKCALFPRQATYSAAGPHSIGFAVQIINLITTINPIQEANYVSDHSLS